LKSTNTADDLPGKNVGSMKNPLGVEVLGKYD
jgi:hypothetical protein